MKSQLSHRRVESLLWKIAGEAAAAIEEEMAVSIGEEAAVITRAIATEEALEEVEGLGTAEGTRKTHRRHQCTGGEGLPKWVTTETTTTMAEAVIGMVAMVAGGGGALASALEILRRGALFLRRRRGARFLRRRPPGALFLRSRPRGAILLRRRPPGAHFLRRRRLGARCLPCPLLSSPGGLLILFQVLKWDFFFLVLFIYLFRSWLDFNPRLAAEEVEENEKNVHYWTILCFLLDRILIDSKYLNSPMFCIYLKFWFYFLSSGCR